MPKRKKKQPIASGASVKRTGQKSNRSKTNDKAAPAPKDNPRAKSTSKQEQLIAMLQSPTGATIDAMMKAAGWQQHSVRGFLAGVVRKRLKLNLGSTKIGDRRVYRVTGGVGGKSRPRSSRRTD